MHGVHITLYFPPKIIHVGKNSNIAILERLSKIQIVLEVLRLLRVRRDRTRFVISYLCRSWSAVIKQKMRTRPNATAAVS